MITAWISGSSISSRAPRAGHWRVAEATRARRRAGEPARGGDEHAAQARRRPRRPRPRRARRACDGARCAGVDRDRSRSAARLDAAAFLEIPGRELEPLRSPICRASARSNYDGRPDELDVIARERTARAARARPRLWRACATLGRRQRRAARHARPQAHRHRDARRRCASAVDRRAARALSPCRCLRPRIGQLARPLLAGCEALRASRSMREYAIAINMPLIVLPAVPAIDPRAFDCHAARKLACDLGQLEIARSRSRCCPRRWSRAARSCARSRRRRRYRARSGFGPRRTSTTKGRALSRCECTGGASWSDHARRTSRVADAIGAHVIGQYAPRECS